MPKWLVVAVMQSVFNTQTMKEKEISTKTAIIAEKAGFTLNNGTWFFKLNGIEYCTNVKGGIGGKEKTYIKCTQSLLQKWLREKHKLFICVKHKITGDLENPIVEFTYNGNNGEWNNKYYSTYEKALEVALVECLQRVLETVA